MRSKPSCTKLVVFIALVLSLATSAQAPIPTAQQLDQLLAPVALYPDSLLAQITTASTNPQEILDVSNWLQQNQGLNGTALTDAAEAQGFDAAFIALVNFPDNDITKTRLGVAGRGRARQGTAWQGKARVLNFQRG